MGATAVYSEKRKRHYSRSDPVDRFWAKVDKHGPLILNTRCWMWTAGSDTKGYGHFYVPGRPAKYPMITAYRFGYELTHGQLAAGLDLDHLCRNPSCVRASHLEPVTHRENCLRGVGFAALNARKTHCPNGHEYDAANTRYDKAGGRHCRACQKEWNAARYRRPA